MSETIGKNIRKLRKERGLTQEELAELLGVSFQAVSKWENKSGLPDISQVVPLANIFGVTTDTLFGTETMDTSGEIDDFIREIEYKLCNRIDKSVLECDLECATEVCERLKIYPSNYRLLAYSMGLLFSVIEDLTVSGRNEEAMKWQNEMIRQGNVILNHCTDADHLNTANKWLVELYLWIGNISKAEEHARRLPKSMRYNNQYTVLATVMKNKGEPAEALKYHGKVVRTALGILESELHKMGNLYSSAEQYCEAYECYALFPRIYELIMKEREADIPFYLFPVYDHLAETCIKLGRYDEALDHLEHYLRHERTIAETYNVITKSKIPYFFGDCLEYSRDHYTATGDLSDVMSWGVFDPIRDTDRFHALLKEVTEFEEKYRD